MATRTADAGERLATPASLAREPLRRRRGEQAHERVQLIGRLLGELRIRGRIRAGRQGSAAHGLFVRYGGGRKPPPPPHRPPAVLAPRRPQAPSSQTAPPAPQRKGWAGPPGRRRPGAPG